MKKLVIFIGLGLLAGLLLVAPAAAEWGCGGYNTPNTPAVVSADGSGFVKTDLSVNQMVYDQYSEFDGYKVATDKTVTVKDEGYGAYHKGPGKDGKGFFGKEFQFNKSTEFLAGCYEEKVRVQGMSQAIDSSVEAGAGISATKGANGSVVAEGGNLALQGQYLTYSLAPGVTGAGAQLSGSFSTVKVDVSAP